MISVNGIEAKAFIEGIEIPVQSVSINQGSNTMSTASVVIPPVSSVPAITPRSLLLIFVKDLNSYTGDEFALQFVGETTEPTVMWSSGGYSISISAYSLDNHWWAIPMYMAASQFAGDVFTFDKPEKGTISGVATPEQEAALLGTSVTFVVNTDGNINAQEIGSNTTMNEFLDGNGSEVPGIFTVLYKSNKFWETMGTRTRMSSAGTYGIVGGADVFGADIMKFMKKHLYYFLQSNIGRNAKFIDWWNLYRQGMFSSWSLNHHSIDKHVLVTTGFEHMFPPACNVIFPHQYSMMASVGQSLSNPTRTIGLLNGLSYTQDDSVIQGGFLFAAIPQELEEMMKTDSTYKKAKEIIPGTDEEWRGIVGNIITPGTALINVIGAAASGGGAVSTEVLGKYFKFLVSDHHVKSYNSSGPSIIPCTFLPNIQVGFPLIAFRSSGSDIVEKQFSLLYGFAQSVQHFISATSASTTVTLVDSKLIGRANAIPTPAPLWVSDKGISFFDSKYNELLGCGTIDAPAQSQRQAFGDLIGSIAKPLAGKVKSFLSGTPASGYISSLRSFLGSAGSGWVDVHASCIEAIEVLGQQYESKKAAKDKVGFASQVVKRRFTNISGALSAFKFEKQRAQWIEDYKKQLLQENKVVANEVGWDILNGSGDLKSSGMDDITALFKAGGK